MKIETRIWLAYVAGRLMTKRRVLQIYDFQQNRHFVFKGKVRQTGVSIHDLARNCFITGDCKKGELKLYDQAERCHISLRVDVKEMKFSGYDYGSVTHFVGKFEQDMVQLFDYRADRYFKFRL
jgi:hypothetical protein